MKKFIGSLIILSIFSSALYAQTTVAGSIRKGSTTSILEVLAKPTAAINAQVGNINITFSIPDQTLTGGTNPAEANITKSTSLANASFIPVDANNPYIIGNRAYYSYLILQSNSASDVASALAAGTDNVIGTFTFASPFDQGIRLDDLTSSGGGPNFQMTWYVQFNQGVGDVTDYVTPFYGYYNAADATNNGGSDAQFVTLVVKFLDFTVIKRDNDALLNWSVENEGSTTSTYEIQQSLDGVNFTKVKTLPALNNGRTANSYSTIVENLSSIRAAGVIYFRVKQTDRDGKFVYTEIRSVRVDKRGLAVSAYPNPVKTTTTVDINLAENADVTVSVIDASGKQVVTAQLQGFKGANTKKLDLSKLAGGAYTLKVQTAAETKVIPLVKVNQ